MNYHVFRLHHGQDLLVELKRYVTDHQIQAATILSAVGCVTKARVRDASGTNIVEILEHMEIVSLMGTLSCNRTHLHIAFSKRDLSNIGGHLTEGCIINTTAEIVIGELDSYVFGGQFDEETGYDELTVYQKNQSKN